jgi:hypothetical protein
MENRWREMVEANIWGKSESLGGRKQKLGENMCGVKVINK